MLKVLPFRGGKGIRNTKLFQMCTWKDDIIVAKKHFSAFLAEVPFLPLYIFMSINATVQLKAQQCVLLLNLADFFQHHRGFA